MARVVLVGRLLCATNCPLVLTKTIEPGFIFSIVSASLDAW